jgi:flagellar hook-associated protein 1 FlgK
MTDLALSSAVSSLMLIQQQMSVASSNISNANTAGYTAESVTVATQVTNGVGSGVQNLGIVSNVDQYLRAQVNTANSESTQASTYNTYYQNLQQVMGQISQSDTGGNDISSQLATLQTDLSSLAATPQNSSLGNGVVSALDDVTSTMRSTSQQIQALRSQADQQISDTVSDVNTQLDTINSLNTQIATAQASGQSTAALDDQRATALQSLSADIGVGYYADEQGALQVYTTGGQPLITGNVVNHLSHDSVSVSGSMTYPGGGINGIMVGNTDITSTISSGKLASLVQQRDSELPAAQNSLNYLAQQVASGLNAVSNLGSASPPPSTLTSASPANYEGSDSVTPSVANSSASPPTSDLTVRIALTDSSGQVQNYRDIDLTSAGVTDVTSLMAAINGAFSSPTPSYATPSTGQPISSSIASLNNGALQLSAPSGQGIAVTTLSGTLTGAQTGAVPTDFSSYFHLNDVITGGASAATISVNPAMLKNSSLLPLGKLNSTVPAPTVPFAGVGAGDGSTAQALASALLTNQTFTTGTATGTATFDSATANLNVAGSFTIDGGNSPVTVQVTAGMTPQDIVNAINAAATANGSTVSASVTGNGIYQVQISSGGNAVTFSNITGNALSSLGLSSLPTGHLGAATTTYGGFASNLISDVASRAAAAQTDSTAKTTTLTALQTTFSNQSGVNVDQQTALLTQLQNLYAASARVITTQTAMFQSLLQAVGG